MIYLCYIMAKKKTHKTRREKLSARYFLDKPHDKYTRFVLQMREVALEMMEYCLPKEVFADIDLESIKLSNTSYIDDTLHTHFSDICYTGLTLGQKPFRISFIFEHKSTKPDQPVLAQLNRYISQIWSEDLNQDRNLSLTIPVLIYHGQVPIAKETRESLFKGAPLSLLPYIPSFDYILLDIARISDEHLEHLQFLLLRNVFLALKNHKNDDYIKKNGEKIIIFAAQIRTTRIGLNLFKATTLYMMSTNSATFHQKFQTMEGELTKSENAAVKPYLVQLFEEGMEKGIEKGKIEGKIEGMEQLLKQFILNNPELGDQKIAMLFSLPIEFVMETRARL